MAEDKGTGEGSRGGWRDAGQEAGCGMAHKWEWWEGAKREDGAAGRGGKDGEGTPTELYLPHEYGLQGWTCPGTDVSLDKTHSEHVADLSLQPGVEGQIIFLTGSTAALL